MFKNSVKLAALCGAFVLAVPATAAVYTYSLADGGTLRIDSTKGSGSVSSATINVDFTSDALKSFKGNTSSFTAALSTMTGTRNGRNVNRSTTGTPAKTQSLSFNNGAFALTADAYRQGYSLINGWGYSSGIGTNVSAPGALLLFGLGVAGLFISYRRRSKPTGLASEMLASA